MIKVGNTSLTLYVGENAIQEAYLGTTRIYPDRETVITFTYSDWTARSLSLSSSVTEIAASGGSATLSAVAHLVRTKTTLAGGVPIATEQETSDMTVTPSLSSNNASFKVSGNKVNCDSRGTTEGNRLNATITGSYGGASASLTLYQQENKLVSYRYRIEVYRVDGAAFGDRPSYHTAYIRTQSAATYTSGKEGDWQTIQGPASSVSVKSSNSVFEPVVNLPSSAPDIGNYEILTLVKANTSTSSRSATITISWKGVTAQYTATQSGITNTYNFRYSYSNQASKYPRFAVNGSPGSELLGRAIGGFGPPIHSLSYRESVTYVYGTTTSYLSGEPKLTQVGPTESTYMGGGSNTGWSDAPYVLGFIMGQQGNFMNNYPYKYFTSAFTLTGSGFTLSGTALFEKEYGDLEKAGNSWYAEANNSGLLSLNEVQAVQQLAETGVVTEEDVPGMTLEEFEALAEKINAARRPDTDTYVQNEDGTWTVVPKEE